MRQAKIRVVLADRTRIALSEDTAKRVSDKLWAIDRRGTLMVAVKLSEARRRKGSVVELSELESDAFLAALEGCEIEAPN
jgi:hypothetical protein